MTPAELAGTHGAAFGGKGWPLADFESYLTAPNIRIFGDEMCFAVMRIAGPEAEVLTLATHPDVQGTGRATVMLADALNSLRASRIEEVFLEVAEDNAAARAVYTRNGFKAFATRTSYYENGVAAICMKTQLCVASPD